MRSFAYNVDMGCSFHDSHCNAYEACEDSSHVTCKGPRVLADACRLWLLMPLLDALNIPDVRIREYRRSQYSQEFWHGSWSSELLGRNRVRMEDLKTAIHSLTPHELFREVETPHCFSPRMRRLLGKKLCAVMNTLTPLGGTNASPSDCEQRAALCSCTVASDNHEVTRGPSTLAGLLFVHARACNVRNTCMYRGIGDALLSRPDFADGQWCSRSETRSGICFVEYGLVTSHHDAAMHRQLLRAMEHSPDVADTLFFRCTDTNIAHHLLAFVLCACHETSGGVFYKCEPRQRTEEEMCAARSVLCAIDPSRFVANFMQIKCTSEAKEEDSTSFVRTLSRLWKYCNHEGVMDTTPLGPFVDALFKAFTAEELCAEWRGRYWRHRGRSFIWYLAFFDREYSITHNYLLDRIVPILIKKMPPKEFLHKVLERETLYGEYVIPPLFGQICGHCDVETVRATYLHIREAMAEANIGLAHPIPSDVSYSEVLDVVLMALEYNTPDVCAYLWQEARAEDSQLASKCALEWLRKVPRRETREVLQPMVKSAAAS